MITRQQFVAAVQSIADNARDGCSNHGCRIAEGPGGCREGGGGQGTNAICRCSPRNFAKDLEYLAERLREYPQSARTFEDPT